MVRKNLILSVFLSFFVNRIYETLVHVNDEHNIISETTYPMKHGHRNNERKQIINERIRRLINKCTPRKMRNSLELIINE